MTEFTCPVCGTVLKTELPDDEESMLPITVYEGIKVCNTCLAKLQEANQDVEDEKDTELINRAKAKLTPP